MEGLAVFFGGSGRLLRWLLVGEDAAGAEFLSQAGGGGGEQVLLRFLAAGFKGGGVEGDGLLRLRFRLFFRLWRILLFAAQGRKIFLDKQLVKFILID